MTPPDKICGRCDGELRWTAAPRSSFGQRAPTSVDFKSWCPACENEGLPQVPPKDRPKQPSS